MDFGAGREIEPFFHQPAGLGRTPSGGELLVPGDLRGDRRSACLCTLAGAGPPLFVRLAYRPRPRARRHCGHRERGRQRHCRNRCGLHHALFLDLAHRADDRGGESRRTPDRPLARATPGARVDRGPVVQPDIRSADACRHRRGSAFGRDPARHLVDHDPAAGGQCRHAGGRPARSRADHVRRQGDRRAGGRCD